MQRLLAPACLAKGDLMAITGAVMLGVVMSVLATTPAVARDLPIKSGRWTNAPSCGDPSARDAANARTFEPGEKSTATILAASPSAKSVARPTPPT